MQAREEYNEQTLIKDALAEMFLRFNIPNNAYTAKTFRISVGLFGIHLPNLPSRVKVARYHDIHHIITGYPANWKGEAEIGIWELVTGCRDSFIAWFLNSGAVLVGLLLYPKAVWRAFLRAKKTKTNLYYNFEYDSLLNMSIKEVRQLVGIDLNHTK